MASDAPLVVAYGAGTNSTAMLIGMVERGVCPDLILFADTGGEKPETYEYVSLFGEWLERHGLSIITVQNDGMYGTLERNCLETETLPSKAYGWSSCSDKYKIRPQNKYVANWGPAQECWKNGGKVNRTIGYHAGETRRSGIRDDDKYHYCYPLIEWDWGQRECLEAIRNAGLPYPGKSACFYCPATRKREVLWLSRKHPELFERAVAIEDKAIANGLQTVKGLGRHWTWRGLVAADEAQLRLMPDPEELPCMCFDGEYETPTPEDDDG